MKICPVCNAQVNDEAAFCTQCGTPLQGAQQQVETSAAAQPVVNTAPAPVTPYLDPFDHTKEFQAQDISEHKLFAMICYLASWLGMIVALLAARDSAYVAFHLRQALKMSLVTLLLGLIMAVLFWTFIIPIAGAVCMAIVFVLRLIAFFQVCGGKAKEPAIIRGLSFLR